MPEIKIINAFHIEDPSLTFLVCDLDEGRDFADPLHLLYEPMYDPYNINEQGLYAFGGEINAVTLEKSYKKGIFPWFAYKINEEANWYCPKMRYVIFPEKIHVSHSQRPLLNRNQYRITINRAFENVIHHCRYVNDRDGLDNSWLSDDIENSFIELHKKGYAKSIEVWEGDELVGGFYGFFYKGVFEGDSMFSLRPSASQIGLILLSLNPYIEGEKIKIIDTQFETSTFKKLGGEYITYEKYREIMGS